LVLIDFDPAKNRSNVAKHGISLAAAADFSFETALTITDDRREYGETRYVAIGLIGVRLHVLCYTLIAGGIRPISLRKANSREIAMTTKRKTLTDAGGEVRELTAEDFARAKTFDQLPVALQATLSTRRRGPQKAPTKVRTSLRLSPEVVEHFKDTGPGWQTRIDAALLQLVAKPAARARKDKSFAKTASKATKRNSAKRASARKARKR
jgi:uncharacterized protein